MVSLFIVFMLLSLLLSYLCSTLDGEFVYSVYAVVFVFLAVFVVVVFFVLAIF